MNIFNLVCTIRALDKNCAHFSYNVHIVHIECN